MPRQLRIKNLKEQRGALIKDMNKANEERNFEVFNAKDKELNTLTAEIEAEERMLSLEMKDQEKDQGKDQGVEARGTEVDLATEIRGLTGDKEHNIADMEIEARDGEFVIGTATGTQASTGNIAKMTFADYIIQKLPYISPLYNRMRKEPLSGKTHAIPVQKKKLPKFVKMKELQTYAKNTASYDQVKMEATKYGTLVVISEECIADTGYDIVTDIKGQILEGYALTLDELMVKGDTEEGIEGLISLNKADGSHEVAQLVGGAISIEEIESIYYAVPKQYRKNGTWIISDDTARLLNGLKYSDGKPLLKEGYNGKPFGEDSTLMGCPVIVSDEMENLDGQADKIGIVFGDLSKGFIVAPRKSLTLQKSTEFAWIEDAVAFKANVRLDIKKALTEAMAYYKLKGGVAKTVAQQVAENEEKLEALEVEKTKGKK